MTKVLNCIEYYLRLPKVVIGLSLSILGIYLFPLFINPYDLWFESFDNLDSFVPFTKILAESGMLFVDSNAIIPNMMGGLPRHTYGSEFNVIVWLFYFFEPITAYVINEVLMHIVAFASMWIFLSHHVLPQNRFNTIYVATGSLYFALLPFFPVGGLSLPLMPLAIHALLNIRDRQSSVWDWSVLLFIPFYSSLVLIYFFFLLVAGFFWLIDSIRKKDIQIHFFLALLVMSLVFLLVEYRLVYVTFLDHTFVSHRTEFTLLFSNDLSGSYHVAGINFLNGQSQHAKGNHYMFVLPMIVIASILAFVHRRFTKAETFIILLLIGLAYAVDIWKILFTTRYFFPVAIVISLILIRVYKPAEKKLPLYFLISILISLWMGFWFNNFWESVKSAISWIETFNMSRFFFFQSLLWAFLAALSALIVAKRLRYGHIFVVLFWIGFSYIAFNNATFGKADSLHKNSYEYYFMEKAFSQIHDFIGKPKSSYRVMTVELDPGVSLYNGFYTIDGYCTNYPLAYKHRFAKIFSEKNKKSTFVQNNFQKWGSKCYAVRSPLLYKPKGFHPYIDNFDFNTTAMKDLKAEYVISPLPITNQNSGLSYQTSVAVGDKSWRLYLYKID